MPGEALPPDYDQAPQRFRTARAVLRRHALAADVHARVAEPRAALAEAGRVVRPAG